MSKKIRTSICLEREVYEMLNSKVKEANTSRDAFICECIRKSDRISPGEMPSKITKSDFISAIVSVSVIQPILSPDVCRLMIDFIHEARKDLKTDLQAKRKLNEIIDNLYYILLSRDRTRTT